MGVSCDERACRISGLWNVVAMPTARVAAKRHNRHHDSLKETDEATALYHAGIRDSLGGYWACRGAAGRR
jgi:hypothetical protein